MHKLTPRKSHMNGIKHLLLLHRIFTHTVSTHSADVKLLLQTMNHHIWVELLHVNVRMMNTFTHFLTSGQSDLT